MNRSPLDSLPRPDAPLRDKLAQLMFVRIGSNLPPVRGVTDDEDRIARLIEKCPVGGLALFNGNFAETPRVLDKLQSASRYPLLVGADFERGVGQQLRGYPLFPHAMAFESLGPDAARAVGRCAELTAAAARAAGVHILFGPVADVNSDPRNPIIATRAFGTQAARVAELVAAFVQGCRRGGALAAAKHFPGHGNTHEDSHHALPSVAATRGEIAARELPPFEAAIAAGAPLIMTAHVRYPALDASGAPASTSHRILVDLLRDEMGFHGAVVSDSLLMEGAKIGYAGEGELALAALVGGVDVLLDIANPEATSNFLEQAVEEGSLDVARVDAALNRVVRLKELAFGAALPAFDEAINRAQTAELAAVAARRSIVIGKNQDRTLPLRRDRPLCAFLVNPYPLPVGGDAPVLGDALRGQFAHVDYHEIGATPAPEQLAGWEKAAAAAEQLLAAIVVKPAAWHRFGLPADVSRWLESVVAKNRCVVACLGAPQGLDPFAAAHALVTTWSDVPASQAALVDALCAD